MIDAMLNDMNVRLFIVRYGNHGYEEMITTDTSLLLLLAHLIAVILNLCSTSWDEFMENLMADTEAQEEFLPFLKIINTSKS